MTAPAARLQDLLGDTPRARARIRRLRVLDRIIAGAITLGGISIILAVCGIFFFVAGEAAPLLFPARARAQPAFPAATGPGRALAVGEDEYREKGWLLTDAGCIRLLDFAAGALLREEPLAGLGAARVLCGARAAARDVIAAGTDDGRVLVAGIVFTPVFQNQRRVAQEIAVAWQFELTLRPDHGPVELVCVTADDERVAVAAAAPGFLGLASRKIEGKRVRSADASAALGGLLPTALALDENAQSLAVGFENGQVYRFAIDGEEAALAENLHAGGEAVSALAYAFGSKTLLVGDAGGAVAGWQGIRSSETSVRTMSRVREFERMPAPVTAFAPSRRNKSFLVIDRRGNVRLEHVTTARTLLDLESPAGGGPLSLAPRSDGVLAAGAGGDLQRAELDAPHPEATLRALFLPQLYEGYDRPEFVWQTSGGTDDNEPKFSLVPLIFGSLKGVLYAMLFSAPLALLAALYTSLFARRRMRGLVKPAVELMGALPSVVIGFLAGLWLSPLVDRNLAACGGVLISIPLGLALAALVFRSSRIRRRLATGRELLYILPFLAAACIGASFAAAPLQDLLFGGDLRAWLVDVLGLAYDRQNCLVVGMALGFAVMPIIFTVSEDAMSNVPRSLRAASDALGASRWQTAWRLVLPAASPGIFAALMLGFGRAIGETMIVVMATGNTPILDLSPLNGMRTISACIATEIPEAPLGGSLYRILFLAGGLLFAFSFLANTAAEVVGERLRRRFARW
ncbi:MAG: ABC transporter permease subunit [Planctomycetes bacterium]|nr:ABC transporter permease subunit [Planctomycetota bacterium]